MKVLFYRKDCIGCNVCVEHAPNYWKISGEDGKATLLNSQKKKEVLISEIGQGDLNEIELAERDCPMRIIKIQK